MTELTALQNAANSADMDGLVVRQKQTDDRRKTVKYYFLTYEGTSISPVLDYENMNHFILGLLRGLKLKTK